MITHTFDNNNLSQEIFAIDIWGAVICSLGHGRKHMLTILPTIWRPGFKQQHHNASIQLNNSDCKVYPSELLSVQDQTSIVSKHNTEIVNHLQIVKYTL